MPTYLVEIDEKARPALDAMCEAMPVEYGAGVQQVWVDHEARRFADEDDLMNYYTAQMVRDLPPASYLGYDATAYMLIPWRELTPEQRRRIAIYIVWTHPENDECRDEYCAGECGAPLRLRLDDSSFPGAFFASHDLREYFRPLR